MLVFFRNTQLYMALCYYLVDMCYVTEYYGCVELIHPHVSLLKRHVYKCELQCSGSCSEP